MLGSVVLSELDMVARKVQLQSREALDSIPGKQERLLVDCLLQNMNPKLQARVAHLVDGKEVEQRPTYYKLVKFAVQKEAEINFDDAKRNRDSTSKPKATSHFHYGPKESNLPTTSAI